MRPITNLRRANDDIALLARRIEEQPETLSWEFACECGGCYGTTVQLSLTEHERLRESGRWILATGHEQTALEPAA